MQKQLFRLMAIILVSSLLLTGGCSVLQGDKNDGPVFNVIFALATIPPVMAAQDCLDNGNETYVIIERGKTYNGIEEIKQFHNVGFDPSNNLSEGFTSKEFWSMVKTVKELNESHENAYFNFYVQDGTALMGAAIAANAGLSTDSFHIFMYEDGSGAYHALYKEYVQGKRVNKFSDEIYKHYVKQVKHAEAEFKEIMSRTNNLETDAPLRYNIGKAFALAALDNFTYCIQDESAILNILKNTEEETKLLTCFGAEGYSDWVNYKLNLRYQKISDGVMKLDDAAQESYLRLMYGQYYDGTYDALTRTQRCDEAAPSQKLVFIGARHGEYPKFASSALYGIGGLSENSIIPQRYADLDDNYKSELLFASEKDYEVFLSVLNDATNYEENLSTGVKHKIQISTFNMYIDYMYTLKLTYYLYGDKYDLIMKGHPREVIGCHDEWGGKYTISEGENETYVYDKLVDNALLAFHTYDSVGKYIGMVPYGTSAENLAYLGADLTICGLPSSTYSGYDTSIDVLFIMAETNQDIIGSGEDEAVSQVSSRYNAGNLNYIDESGVKCPINYLNIGNMYKNASKVYRVVGNSEMADKYDELFADWLKQKCSGAADIDAQGFPVS